MGTRMDTQLHEAVEADLDHNYHSVPVAHANKAIATWYLCTAMEDNLRLLLTGTPITDASVVELHLDRQKYAARFALSRIKKECKDHSSVLLPRSVVPKLYLKTMDLLMAGIDYMGATQLCSAAHVGTLKFEEFEGKINVVANPVNHDKRYSALELLGHFLPGMVDHTARLFAWSHSEELVPEVVSAIARLTSVVEDKIVYEYRPSFAVGLSEVMSQPPEMVPEGWSFPWGGRKETQLLINALCVRCMYHWISVNFGAQLNKLRGGGETSLFFVVEKSRLIQDVREMCSLSERVVRSFVQYLTYGFSMNVPDPALQPIIPLGGGLVGIPCLMFLSSNYERNILSLQARIDSSTFDSKSKLFEDGMVRDLLNKILPRWPLAKGNVIVRVGGKFEEVDLLIADPSSQTLLVCELRWMLQPGDPREVNNRKKVCWEKVEQLARKVLWIRERKEAALRVLNIEGVDSQTWQVEGIVVIQTFGGALSKRPEFPIMPSNGFVQGIEHADSIRRFASWSQSLGWLPQEGVHFRMVPQEMNLSALSKPLVVFGIEKLCSPQKYSNFVKQSILNYVME